MATFQAAKAALARRREGAQARDERRGYSIDKKRVVLAYLTESVVVAASLYGAWLFANTYGHNDWRQVAMMMLAPIGYAVIEYTRVPLALSVRSHRSYLVKMLALVGVICASGVTVKSMSQLGEIMFRPRLFDVVHASEDLQRAKDTQASMIQKITAADALVDQRRETLSQGETLAKTAAEQLAALPKEQCHASSGIGRNGQPWSGQVCKADSRIAPLRDNLKQTVAARDALAQHVEDAVRARAALDRSEVDQTVAATTTAYREALLHSQLHSFTGMFYGVGPTEVTDEQINRFLRIFVFFPAIFVAFASTLVAFTAVHKVKPALEPFDGAEFLLNPIYQQALDDTMRQVVEHQRRDAATIGAKA